MADRVYPLRTDLQHNVETSSLHHHHSYNIKPFQQSVYRDSAPRSGLFLQRPPRRRHCNPCCCCLGWVCGILVSILLVLASVGLLLYLVLQPKFPKFSVTDVHVSTFNLTDRPLVQSHASAEATHYLQTKVNFTVKVGNPNKKIEIYYEEIDVAALFYQATQIGTGSLPSFNLGHRDTKDLHLEMDGQDTPLTQSVASGLQTAVSNGGSIWLQVKTATHANIKIWRSKSAHSKFEVNCEAEISNPAAGKRTLLLSKSCKLKVVNLWL